MNIETKNPIIIDGVQESRPSEYLSADGDEFYNVDGDDFYNADSDDFYNARGKRRKRRGWRKAIGFLPPVALARAVSSADGDEFYNAEGDSYSYIEWSNRPDVKSFQDFLDAKGLKWVGATNAKRDNGSKLNKGYGYGNDGPSTRNAYAVYGAEWEALKNPPQGTPAVTPSSTTAPSIEVVTTNVPQIPAGQQPTVAQIEEQKKKGIFWDNLKGTWIVAKQSGVLDWLAGLVGIKMPQGQQGNLPPVGSPQYGANTTSAKDRKLSRNAKIAIGLGSVLVIGLIIYSVRRNRK